MITIKKKGNRSIVEKMYRKMRKHYLNNRKLVAHIYYRLIYILFNCVIPPSVEIGKDTKIPHGVGIVLHYKAKIGDGCKIYQNVTIGSRGEGGGCATIGDNVVIGANACILGRIHIGNDVSIGAGSVVLKNVPSYSTVIGNPSQIIEKC